MQSGIYKIVNIINGKLYVGSAVNFGGRWWKHKNLLRKNKHHSSHLQAAWNKYREENFSFEIIEECEPLKEVLETREQYYIDTLKPEYNICPKAYNTQGRKTTEQTKKKISESLRGKFAGENSPNFGKTGENCPNFGKHHSEQTKQKLSEALGGKYDGENNPMFGKTGENSPVAKLNWNIVHEIRRRRKEERVTYFKLAEEYDVSISCIQAIAENRVWKEEQRDLSS